MIVNINPDQDCDRVTISAKNAAYAPTSHAAQNRACLAPIAGSHTKNASAITTGSMTIPEYAVALASAKVAAEAATSSPRYRRRPACTASHTEIAVRRIDSAS
jgi:hypothetical protein